MELKRETGEWRERHIKDIKQKDYLLLQYGRKPPFHFSVFSLDCFQARHPGLRATSQAKKFQQS